MWNWIKDKFKRFWGWMLPLVIIPIAFAAAPAPVNSVTAPENNTFQIGVKNYQSEFKSNITDDQTLQYKLDDKFISFKPVELRLDTGQRLRLPQHSGKQGNAMYRDIFGDGIDLEVLESSRVWSKVVSINALPDIASSLPDTGYVELVFEIETNFVIDGWDNKSDYFVTDKVRLGDFSYIEPAQAWDSYSETICDDGIDEEQICETSTNRINLVSYFSSKGNKKFFTKQIPLDWIKSAQYPIFTDVDVTYGTTQTFDTGIIHNISVTELDTDKFITCYTEEGDDDAFCRAGTVSGTTITYGTEKTIDTSVAGGVASGICVAKNDTDEAVIIYADSDSTMSVFPASTTGTTINLGSKTTGFSDSAMDTNFAIGNNWCDQLGTDKLVTVYQQEDTANDPGFAFITTIDADSILTKGTEVQFESGESKYPATCKVDTDKFIVVYEDQADTDNLKTVASSVSGTTISGFGTIVTIDSGNANIPDCDQISADKVSIVYNDGANSQGETVVATLSGTTITLGTIVIVDTDSLTMIVNTALDSTRYLIAYPNPSSSSRGTSRLATIAGDTTVTLGDEEVFETGSIGGAFSDYGLSTDLISTDKIVICYQDDDDTDDGKCIIGDVAALAAVVSDKIGPGVIWIDSD